MDAHNPIVDLATTAQPLPCGTDGFAAALGRSRFIQATDGFRVSVLAGHHNLRLIAHAILIPLDRFDETL